MMNTACHVKQPSKTKFFWWNAFLMMMHLKERCAHGSEQQPQEFHAADLQGLVKRCDKCLTLTRLMSYIYGAPILDVSRSHTTTQHSR